MSDATRTDNDENPDEQQIHTPTSARQHVSASSSTGISTDAADTDDGSEPTMSYLLRDITNPAADDDSRATAVGSSVPGPVRASGTGTGADSGTGPRVARRRRTLMPSPPPSCGCGEAARRRTDRRRAT